MAFKKTANGLKAEVVHDYQDTDLGTVIPNSFDDNYGGRPGLDANTVLHPVDDPWGIEEEVPLVSSRAARKATAPTPPYATPPASAPTGPPPDPFRVEKTMPADTVNPQLGPNDNAADDARISKLTALLEDLVTHPAVAALLPGNPVGSRSSDMRAVASANDLTSAPPGLFPGDKTRAAAMPSDRHRPPTMSSRPGPDYVQVTLEGDFGRFRSRVADVVICENHVALIYTGVAGDDDLAYEPPMGRTFYLHVPLVGGEFKRLSVQHFGLVTRLTSLGNMVIVVLPFASPTPPPMEDDDHDA